MFVSLIFTITVAAIFILSCSKKNSDAADNPQIKGTWNVDSLKTVEFANGVQISSYTDIQLGTLTFNADGSLVGNLGGAQPETGVYIYDAASKTISIKFQGDAKYNVASILQHTASRLVAKSQVTYSPPLSGVDAEEVTIYLSK